MESILIAVCSISVVAFIVVGGLLCSRRKKPTLKNSIVIAESLQPEVLCKSVPCQHPYYRVIFECSRQNIPENNLTREKNNDRNTNDFNETEWFKNLHLTSIPRKTRSDSMNSRRSSLAEHVGTHSKNRTFSTSLNQCV
ncbi:uncharacterized protein [Parasteatoda tepidariorum]|uniref:uncharacterized protein n=1 Tax=Parasteatoda tepidariorum TaxID=114398 RepID=UPI0039BCF20F